LGLVTDLVRLAFATGEADNKGMTNTLFLRSLPLALVAFATAASAQYVTVQPGQPANMTAAPGPVGVPGGRMGNNALPDVASDPSLNPDPGRPKPAREDAARAAKADELKVGAEISDSQGAEVGYIKAIASDGVVVATVGGQVRVPAEAIGKNKKGLLIGMKKADFDKLVAGANGG